MKADANAQSMKFLLDTNTVSELMRANPVVLAHLTERPRDEVVIPQPVVAEIEFGLSLLPLGKRKRTLVQRWQLFSHELLRVTWNDAVSSQFAVTKAQLRRAGSIIEDLDIAIAAHAMVWDLQLVTNNTSHFRRIKRLRLVDWTSAPGELR
jgi:predicted nucleic acid-binding protein